MTMPTEPPPITEAEWQVMQLLWELLPVGARELAAELGRRQGWSEATVKTLLNRLLKKGALGYELDGQRYLYHPAVSREECVESESESFLHRVFAGKTSPLLAHFLREGRLSAEEVDELRELLRTKEKETER